MSDKQFLFADAKIYEQLKTINSDIKLAYLLLPIHLIITNASFRKSKKMNDIEIPISHNTLRRYGIPNNRVKPILDLLLDNNIIKKVKGFIVGKKSQHFQLINPIHKIIRVKTSDILVKKIDKEIGFSLIINPIYQKVIDNILLLQYDKVRAKKYLYNHREKFSMDDFVSYNIRVDTWTTQSPSVCKYGRLHYPITSTAKCLRQFIYFDKCKQMYACDIVNSQVYFLLLLISKVESITKTEEYIRFRGYVLGGTIYNVIANEIGFDIINKRKEFKQKFYQHFLFAKKINRRNNIVKAINKMFPNILASVEEFQKNDVLAHELQRLESSTIYNFLNEYLSKNHCDNVITLHDSFISDNCELLEDIRQAFIEYCQSLYCLTPSLKIELFAKN